MQPVVRLDEWLKPVGSPHAKVAAMETAIYMRNMLLRDSDWAGMVHSLEMRTPMVDISLFRALAPYLSHPIDKPAKHHLISVPSRPLPEAIRNRPKSGFSIPVREWLEHIGDTQEQRGLRGWSLRVHVNW